MIQTWALTDHIHDLNLDNFALERHSYPGAAGECWATKRTLQAGLSKGVETVTLGNDNFRCTVIPTRGMGIWRARCGNHSLGWHSPVLGPVHPMWVNQAADDGIGWLSGFDELLVRCGLESNGAPEFHADGRLRYPLHGKIANLPAHKLELSLDTATGELALSGTVDEARMFGVKLRLETTITIAPGRQGFRLNDKISNLSAEPGEFQLLYHTNFGRPFCAPGSRVVLPVKKLAPRDKVSISDIPTWQSYGPEMPGIAEVAFYIEPGADADGHSQALLISPNGQQAVGMGFDVQQCPCFIIWKNRHAQCDGYVTGLEPATNFPNVRSFEKAHGRVVTLAPGESREFDVEISVYESAAVVKSAEEAIARIQAGMRSKILNEPDAEWSPV
jgi:galactose mutarotase-like enzyme